MPSVIGGGRLLLCNSSDLRTGLCRGLDFAFSQGCGPSIESLRLWMLQHCGTRTRPLVVCREAVLVCHWSDRPTVTG